MGSMQPIANHILVAIPKRFVETQKKGDDGILIRTYNLTPGLLEQIQRGYGEIPFEQNEEADRQKHREGMILALPSRLDDGLEICEGPFGRQRNGFDIYPELQVGDLVHVDPFYLEDENEIEPGVYRIPYTGVFCFIQELTELTQHGDVLEGLDSEPETYLHPIAGLAFLKPVYPVGATKQEDGSYAIQRGGLWEAVGPVPNEGEVQYLSVPLGNHDNYVCKIGDRVLFEGFARQETIRGTDYLLVQQDTIAAVLSSNDCA